MGRRGKGEGTLLGTSHLLMGRRPPHTHPNSDTPIEPRRLSPHRRPPRCQTSRSRRHQQAQQTHWWPAPAICVVLGRGRDRSVVVVMVMMVVMMVAMVVGGRARSDDASSGFCSARVTTQARGGEGRAHARGAAGRGHTGRARVACPRMRGPRPPTQTHRAAATLHRASAGVGDRERAR